jgi:CubicO group peptidase (beta-lactamase class C family)
MKKLAFTLVYWSISFTIFAQNTSDLPSFVKDSMDTYLQRAMKEWQIPGVSVAIIKGDKVVFAKGYGVKEIGKPDKIDENTLFMIGSNTKAFTATALAMLEQDKKLSLDDKVSKWLPNFKLYDPLATQEVRIKDLLSHRLGFETFQGDFTYWRSNLSRQEVMQKMAKIKPPYGFRDKWGYCNAAFLTAGEIIPAVNGQTWESFLTEKIFKPLQMNTTLALSADFAKAANRATPYAVVEGKLMKIEFPVIDNLAPAGSIGSSAREMSNWAIALLNEGKFEGREVLSPKVIQKTREIHSFLGKNRHPFNKTNYNLYGLGWGLEDYEGREIVSHTGGVDGFLSSFTLIPAEKLGIVILTSNSNNAFYEALKQEIMDAYLGLPYRNYHQLYFKNYQQYLQNKTREIKIKKDSVKLNLKPPLAISSYTGTYQNEVYGKIQIILEKNQLLIKFSNHPFLTARLESLGNNRFLCTYSDPTFGDSREFPFVVEEGKVKSFTLSVDDFVEFTTYQFVKD